jgi:hypothetical protein
VRYLWLLVAALSLGQPIFAGRQIKADFVEG